MLGSVSLVVVIFWLSYNILLRPTQVFSIANSRDRLSKYDLYICQVLCRCFSSLSLLVYNLIHLLRRLRFCFEAKLFVSCICNFNLLKKRSTIQKYEKLTCFIIRHGVVINITFNNVSIRGQCDVHI